MNIRAATELDIELISAVYEKCFPEERNHLIWIQSSFASFPRGVYYVLEQQETVVGYILWCVKNGFRDSTVIELEQVAIYPQYSGQGLGRKLIDYSFESFKKHVENTGYQVGAVMVTTTEGNFAENLYRSTLKVSTAAILPGYASGNEIILYNNSIAK
jgi:ribosomal protein S18 acetylase RimI-like enzyme